MAAAPNVGGSLLGRAAARQTAPLDRRRNPPGGRGTRRARLRARGRACTLAGKGTLFRLFGDRSRLLTGLPDHAEQTYQASFFTGPPSLGAGSPPSSAVLRPGSHNLPKVVQDSGDDV
ncbi:hypothetical protein ACWCPF_43125 [Streptomyces sp. NPDC001858]